MSRPHRDKLPAKVIAILDRYKTRMNKQIEGLQRSIDTYSYRNHKGAEMGDYITSREKKIQHNVKVLKLIEELQELLRK